MIYELIWSCESRDPDLNLGKLVPLEVHDKLKNAKITEKYFPISKLGLPYNCWKAKEKGFPTS